MDESNISGLGVDAQLVAMMRDVKLSLYTIARQAELGSVTSLADVQCSAEQTMRLIDSYILSAQAEYGQTSLALAPVGIGSVMHDAAYTFKNEQKTAIKIQAKAHMPVMSHTGALGSLLYSVARALNEMTDQELIFRSYVAKNGAVGVGVFAKHVNLKSEDLEMTQRLAGQAHMPTALHSTGSGSLLVIASSLARALGGKLEVKRMGRLRGFATTLPVSEQLSFV